MLLTAELKVISNDMNQRARAVSGAASCKWRSPLVHRHSGGGVVLAPRVGPIEFAVDHRSSPITGLSGLPTARTSAPERSEPCSDELASCPVNRGIPLHVQRGLPVRFS